MTVDFEQRELVKPAQMRRILLLMESPDIKNVKSPVCSGSNGAGAVPALLHTFTGLPRLRHFGLRVGFHD